MEMDHLTVIMLKNRNQNKDLTKIDDLRDFKIF